jgi:hypothetical protein
VRGRCGLLRVCDEHENRNSGRDAERAERHYRYLPADAHEQAQAHRAAEHELAHVAEEIVGAQRRTPARVGVSVRNDRRSERVLHGGADSGEEQHDEDHPEAGRVAERDERECRDQGADRKEVPLAETLGEKPRGNLESGQRRAMRRANQPDLREREPEGLGEQRKQDVSNVGQAVVQRMGGTTRSERAPWCFLYNCGVHIAVYIFAALFLVLALGLLFAWYRERHTGTLFMAMAYGGGAGCALVYMEWWPLVAAFVIAWLVRFAGLDPDAPRQPRS